MSETEPDEGTHRAEETDAARPLAADRQLTGS